MSPAKVSGVRAGVIPVTLSTDWVKLLGTDHGDDVGYSAEDSSVSIGSYPSDLTEFVNDDYFIRVSPHVAIDISLLADANSVGCKVYMVDRILDDRDTPVAYDMTHLCTVEGTVGTRPYKDGSSLLVCSTLSLAAAADTEMRGWVQTMAGVDMTVYTPADDISRGVLGIPDLFNCYGLYFDLSTLDAEITGTGASAANLLYRLRT